MLSTTKSTAKMATILLEMVSNDLAINSIEHKGGDFFKIYFDGGSVQHKRDIIKSLKGLEMLSVCNGEDGYDVSKGAFIMVNY